MEPGRFFTPFMDDYFAECEEHLASLRRLLLEIEERGQPGPLLEEKLRGVFRSLHTLKGLSGMVGFAESERVAHALEDWLRRAAPGGALPGDARLDLLFDGVTLLERCLNARRTGSGAPDVEHFVSGAEMEDRRDPADTAEQAGGAAPPPPGEAGELSPAESVRVQAALARRDRLLEFEFVPTPERVARGVGVEAVRERLGALGEILRVSPRVLPGRGVAFLFLVALPAGAAPPEDWRADGLTWSDPEPSAAEPDGSGPVAPPAPGTVVPASNVVRVELARLDELLRLIGDLVISRSRLDETLSRPWERVGTMLDALGEINGGMERQLRELREAVMRVRLVPVGEAFERMRFVVRDVANAAGKEVRVELRGQGTEIDKLVVERIMEPLLHLVRNAVSHGIETAAERAAAGKPPQGRLVLSAAAAGERVRIDVEDDGRGIDREAVLARAHAQGLALAEGARGDEALLDILCAPGFSTREVADLASGRGVGMDVVRSAIRALGGDLSLSSEAGRGTRFTIELPLTLMIVDALLLRIGEQTMALPQPALLEVIAAESGDVVHFENNEVMRYRDRVLPLLRLRRLFGIGDEGEPDSFPVLVVGTEVQPLGLVVDRIAGLREIVVRSLSDPLVTVPGVAAAAELGDGRVCLILDSAELVQLGHRLRGGAAAIRASA